MFVDKFHPKIVLFSKLPKDCKLAIVWWMAHDNDLWLQHKRMLALKDVAATIVVDKVSSGKIVSVHVIDADDPESVKRNRKTVLESSLAFYDKKYGKTQWGIATVPVRHIMDELHDATNGFGKYHEVYCKNNSLENHPKRNRWPLVIHPDTGAIEDGYHRFHSYINQKAKTVRCVWLVE